MYVIVESIRFNSAFYYYRFWFLFELVIEYVVSIVQLLTVTGCAYDVSCQFPTHTKGTNGAQYLYDLMSRKTSCLVSGSASWNKSPFTKKLE